MQQITVREVPALLKQLADQGSEPLLLDVREPWEVNAAALDLPGVESMRIPMSSLAQRLDELDRNRPILGLCHHGMRSAQVLMVLSQIGFAEVYNIMGGIHAWSTQVDPNVPVY
jgi:rhodanese-related sulfurtransferase